LNYTRGQEILCSTCSAAARNLDWQAYPLRAPMVFRNPGSAPITSEISRTWHLEPAGLPPHAATAMKEQP
jgi:hypothetical protein